MENFEEKMGRKTFWSVFSLVGRKENKCWGSSVFSLGPPKNFLSKIERKLREESSWNELPKIPLEFTSKYTTVFFFLWFFLSVANVCWLPLFFFFYFFLFCHFIFSFFGTNMLGFFFFGCVAFFFLF